MESAEGGDLLLLDGSRLQRLTAQGRWVSLPHAPKYLPQGNDQPGEVWLRGRYLVRGERAEHSLPSGQSREDYTILVTEALTGRKVRRFRWSVDP